MYGQKVIIKRKPSISETKEENNNYTVTDMDAQVSQNTSDNNNSVTIHTHSENGNISEHHFHTIVRPNGCVSMQPVGRVMQKKYLSPPRDPFNNQYPTGKTNDDLFILIFREIIFTKIFVILIFFNLTFLSHYFDIKIAHFIMFTLRTTIRTKYSIPWKIVLVGANT